MRRIVSKPSSMSWIYIGIFVTLVVILFILLTMSHKNSKQSKEDRRPTSIEKQPIIIIDSKSGSTGGGDVPIYPKQLPRYSNSQAPLDYQQVGILTSQETEKEPVILPLFGRKVYGRSDRWQYYTATDKNNMIRIPLQIGSRECEDTVGCNELYTGDKLGVGIYQGREFTATIYKTDAPQYFGSAY